MEKLCGRWDLRDFMDAQDGSCGMVNRKEKPSNRSLCFGNIPFNHIVWPMSFQCLLLSWLLAGIRVERVAGRHD